jgi:hypothetical protein
MFDHETRSLVTYEHVEQLRRAARAAAPPRTHGARRSFGDWLIRLGERLAREKPAAAPCREASSRV